MTEDRRLVHLVDDDDAMASLDQLHLQSPESRDASNEATQEHVRRRTGAVDRQNRGVTTRWLRAERRDFCRCCDERDDERERAPPARGAPTDRTTHPGSLRRSNDLMVRVRPHSSTMSPASTERQLDSFESSPVRGFLSTRGRSTPVAVRA